MVCGCGSAWVSIVGGDGLVEAAEAEAVASEFSEVASSTGLLFGSTQVSKASIPCKANRN